MNQPSIQTSFAGDTRVHISFATRSLEASAAFYENLLGQPPVKRRPGYVKFETADPSLNLSLIADAKARPVYSFPSHFGLQVKDTQRVEAMAQRMQAAGYKVRTEEDTVCCYAAQTKMWAEDPDGNPWEVFVVLDQEPQAEGEHACEPTPCGEAGCCGR